MELSYKRKCKNHLPVTSQYDREEALQRKFSKFLGKMS